MSDTYFLVRQHFLNRLFIWMLQNTSFLLPIKRVRETEAVLVFHHPKPAYPFHVILIPKKVIHPLSDLSPAESFLADLITVTQSLVAEYHLSAYQPIVNGGEYQEFPH
jgi:histidine triad (HIT) family protein